MKNTDTLKKQFENYSLLCLRYHVQEDESAKKTNAMTFETMKAALNEVGINLNVKDGELILSLYPEKYLLKKTRNAGKRKHLIQTEDGKIYRYSDIISMNQTMKDEEIWKTIGMTSATYYRHKKNMKQSEYYKKLDKTKLADIDYLTSVSGNFFF